MFWLLVAFCITPIPQSEGFITSTYGWRLLPDLDHRTFHNGIDIRAKLGTPVRAVRKGKVTFAFKDMKGGGGLMVDVATVTISGTFVSRYAHLHKILVKKGDTVKKGQIVGTVGSTGFSTGPHLHFETFTISDSGARVYYDPAMWVCNYRLDLQVPHFKEGSKQ